MNQARKINRHYQPSYLGRQTGYMVPPRSTEEPSSASSTTNTAMSNPRMGPSTKS